MKEEEKKDKKEDKPVVHEENEWNITLEVSEDA